ncbi:hypothetical protein [Stutzerimonas nitrititolerans]|uniref:hypothetical protein n=1 Tax=Stutzerimonas nitrititolerans TaxID=2482751 RepID=UPI0028B24CC5|nr:hypothetical protein [Stutzerimonas nitrititolerans]
MFLDDQFGQEGGRDYYLVEVRHGDPVELKANADRLAACFNACEGLDTVSLRAVAELGGLAARLPVIRGLTRQNAELLAALEDAEGVMRSLGQASPTALAKADEYAKSIAKAKGGAA